MDASLPRPTHGNGNHLVDPATQALLTFSSPPPTLADASSQTEDRGSTACLVIYDVDELEFHYRNESAHKELQLYHLKCLTALNTSTGPRICAYCDCYERGDFTPFGVPFHTCDSVSRCPGCPAEYPTVFYCDSICRRLHRDSHKFVCLNIDGRSRRAYQPPVIAASRYALPTRR